MLFKAKANELKTLIKKMLRGVIKKKKEKYWQEKLDIASLG